MTTPTMERSGATLRRAYGLPELAASLGCSAAFLRLEAARGRLPVTRLGRRVLVLAEDLERYLAEGRADA